MCSKYAIGNSLAMLGATASVDVFDVSLICRLIWPRSYPSSSSCDDDDETINSYRIYCVEMCKIVHLSSANLLCSGGVALAAGQNNLNLAEDFNIDPRDVTPTQLYCSPKVTGLYPRYTQTT